MARRRTSSLAFVFGLQIYLSLACENKDICPDVADETVTSFYQRFLQLQLRGQKSVKSKEDIARDADVASSESQADNTEARDKWQEFEAAADEEDTVSTFRSSSGFSSGLHLVATRMEQKLGTGMGTVLLVSTPPKKPISDMTNKTAKKYRQKFDEECPADDQDQYHWFGERGAKLLQKASDIFDEADRQKSGKVELKDLATAIGDAFPGAADEATSGGGSIDKAELYEMLKYFQYKKDLADGVFNKKAKDSDSSDSSDSGKEKKKKAGAKAKAAGGKVEGKGGKKKDDSSSSDGGGAADIATGIAVGVVADEVVDAALNDSDSD